MCGATGRQLDSPTSQCYKRTFHIVSSQHSQYTEQFKMLALTVSTLCHSPASRLKSRTLINVSAEQKKKRLSLFESCTLFMLL
ncbi:hypothetical protein XELAEV_18003236mg [Xenopus laevis]|uniref:Uncharacterized protein n=1 Tax=Xenopus laevis TaxID=8355 RepID=A0A974BNA9_XENLA|nr:hypothetical protein XELAEV_18003236mg [Xenopus laevis]